MQIPVLVERVNGNGYKARGTEKLGLKNTKINERFSLQFRLETFDLLNRANFGDPGNNVRLATFGTITSTPELQSAKEGGGAVVGGVQPDRSLPINSQPDREAGEGGRRAGGRLSEG